MKIDKIKNYNQTLLAILGTLACVVLLLCVVMMVIEIFPGRYSPATPQGLIADEKVETLNQENLRKQIISYETPWLIDTLNDVYIIPVSIKTLKKPEEVELHNEETLNLLNTSYRFKGRGYYGYQKFDGKYANLIIYQPSIDRTKSLFSERLIIGEIKTYYFKDDILLTFYAASKDTDKNGIIDLNDLRSIYLYSLKNETMRKVSDGDNQIEKYQFVGNSKDLLIEFSLHQYKTTQFDNHQSPSKIMKYNFEEQKLVSIIPENIQNEMQKLVEGKL
ncbi:MAG: hypothetical protein LUH22_02110 [Bacteroides sp.]|nr:hypothetical protein [Bacteroides sp.]